MIPTGQVFLFPFAKEPKEQREVKQLAQGLATLRSQIWDSNSNLPDSRFTHRSSDILLLISISSICPVIIPHLSRHQLHYFI